MVSLKVLLVVGIITSDNYEMKTLCNHSFMNAIILTTQLNGLCEEYLPNEIFFETGCKISPIVQVRTGKIKVVNVLFIAKVNQMLDGRAIRKLWL